MPGAIKKFFVAMFVIFCSCTVHAVWWPFPGGGSESGDTTTTKYAVNANGVCAPLCTTTGLQTMKTSTGYETKTFSKTYSSPKLVVSLDSNQCYLDLAKNVPGGDNSGINVLYNNTGYHTSVNESCLDCDDGNTFCFVAASATYNSSNPLAFDISAAGNFVIDWGDGTIEEIEKNTVGLKTYSHSYTTSSTAKQTPLVKISGRATEYVSNETVPAISFAVGTSLASPFYTRGLTEVSGCLGCIFPTLADGTHPRFFNTFLHNTQLTTVPDNFFKGIDPTVPYLKNMFYGTFRDCPALTGDSPKIGKQYLYDIWTVPDLQFTYTGSTSLSDYNCIPKKWGGAGMCGNDEEVNVFVFSPATSSSAYSFMLSAAGEFMIDWGDGSMESVVKTRPSEQYISHTYSGRASNYEITLTGTSKDYLPTSANTPVIGFSNQRMGAADTMGLREVSGCLGCIFPTLAKGTHPVFSWTFLYNQNLTSEIPEDFFKGVDPNVPYLENMFYETFRGCTGLQGYSPKIDDEYLYDIWTPKTQQFTFTDATRLADYPCIPTIWGGGGQNCTGSDKVFSFMPATANKQYRFMISAAGDFTIDWGDGRIENIHKSSPGQEFIQHNYSNPAHQYTIVLSGTATRYVSMTNGSWDTPVISFSREIDSEMAIRTMDGCLACVFPSLGGESVEQPIFYSTFFNNDQLNVKLPEKLFKGLYGKPATNMFRRTFEGTSVYGDIPKNFFGSIGGEYHPYVFSGTFNGTRITSIPDGLFKSFVTSYGGDGERMFNSTFANTQIQSVSSGVFNGINLSYPGMFANTFSGCKSLMSVDSDLFANITAPQSELFKGTFSGCASMGGTTPSFKNLDGETAAEMFHTTFENTALWFGTNFGHLTGDYKSQMFYRTFADCPNLRSLSEIESKTQSYGDRLLHLVWPNVSGQQTYANDTNLPSYDTLPSGWK